MQVRKEPIIIIPAYRKRYCQKCLSNHYGQNIIQMLQQNRVWSCPFKRSICDCHHCHSKQCQEQYSIKDTGKERDFLGSSKGVHYDIPFNSRSSKNKLNNLSSNQALVNDQFYQVLNYQPKQQPRQSVWEETMYRNMTNDEATVYVLKGKSQHQLSKSLKSSVAQQRTQGALSLNAHLLKSLEDIQKSQNKNPGDEQELKALLEHNLYYLARNADYAKEKGLYNADIRVNSFYENGLYQPNLTRSAKHDQPLILQAIAKNYQNYISQKNQHDEYVRMQRERKSKEFNQKQKEKMNNQEQKLRRQYQELKRAQKNQQIAIDQLLQEIQLAERRNKETQEKLQIGNKKLREKQVYIKFLSNQQHD